MHTHIHTSIHTGHTQRSDRARLKRAQRGRLSNAYIHTYIHAYIQGIREGLVERGWKEHREEDSLIFDLKWTIKTSDIPFKALNRDQIVNHFQRNGNLTTKVGLTRNLRSLKWFEDVVSMYVCVYIRICVCMRVYISIRLSITSSGMEIWPEESRLGAKFDHESRLGAKLAQFELVLRTCWVCMYACMYILHAWEALLRHANPTYIHTYIHTCYKIGYGGVHLHTYVWYIHTYIHTIWTNSSTYMPTYIHMTWTYIHLHTCIHTCIHT
jgi:hypothetical protein